MLMKNSLLIIDPQNDFCSPEGSLFVKGAEEDCRSIKKVLENLDKKIDSIIITMDMHHFYDISHPGFWINAEGEKPVPYTIITKEDLVQGIWKPANPENYNRALDYLIKLELNKNFSCCIWPPHCLIGSPGAGINQEILDSACKWEVDNGKPVNFVYKGSNIFTEHYSAIRAEVPDPEDRQTVTNMGVIKILKNSDRIIVCGEALSHCVKYTVNDIIEYIPEEKLYILDDCSSPVTGFEEQGKAFLREMKERGANIVSSDFVIENF